MTWVETEECDVFGRARMHVCHERNVDTLCTEICMWLSSCSISKKTLACYHQITFKDAIQCGGMWNSPSDPLSECYLTLRFGLRKTRAFAIVLPSLSVGQQIWTPWKVHAFLVLVTSALAAAVLDQEWVAAFTVVSLQIHAWLDFWMYALSEYLNLGGYRLTL